MSPNPQRFRELKYWLARISSVTVAALLLILLTVSKPKFMLEPSREMEIGGEHRFYDVRPPNKIEQHSGAPLLLVLHGGGSSASRVEKLFGTTSLGNERGYIVVYPEGIDGFWNDGRAGTYSRAARNQIDDVGFIDAVIQAMKKEYRIDASRIYLLGMANGGMMVMRYACERPESVAGIAVFSASLPVELADSCSVGIEVPALLSVGDADPFMPYAGGPIAAFGDDRGRLLGARETAALWARANGCERGAVSTLLPDTDDMDGLQTSLLSYNDCPGGEVRLYTVEGGGHTIPGLPQHWPEALVGKTTFDFNAVKTAMDFFDPAEGSNSQ